MPHGTKHTISPWIGGLSGFLSFVSANRPIEGTIQVMVAAPITGDRCITLDLTRGERLIHYCKLD